jgi:hypothetical protein
MPTRYRQFRITYDPPPIPDRQHDYRWSHEDYDGPEDARCGTSPSLDAAQAAIDDWYAEHE